MADVITSPDLQVEKVFAEVDRLDECSRNEPHDPFETHIGEEDYRIGDLEVGGLQRWNDKGRVGAEEQLPDVGGGGIRRSISLAALLPRS